MCDGILLCQQEANYSHNEIEVLGNFNQHKSLTTLKVACILNRSKMLLSVHVFVYMYLYQLVTWT